ncbi:Gfo/Idh/MocA family protein [Pseudogracilibacillus auburnensis]|uniref:Gfo/Idh/MocA family protein n=1 Tax=Pseudogracilibacillus auburnensis TaxID=1494959 RepID=UPI001A965A58|nr:Gfo/Idh/MocA family oxidoreductase [Pseudogracilibacillus auburnensis]MBO1003975.1 Gfo/Idh/MocA family oxidoreductase [Pseudogracilibacillus auburnensis]
MEKVKVGLIGCGMISEIYLKNISEVFQNLDVVAVADINLESAQTRATQFNIPKACTPEELLADEEIEMIINLTIPSAHAPIALQAIEKGKHVFMEKPLAVTREDGQKVLQAAKEKGVYVGSAPDTFLGGGLQTCRKLIDDGWIGEPIGATAFMMGSGPEGFHPNPDFFYVEGGGPMFDMGPYYLTALINLIGPIKRVTGSARATYSERTIQAGPRTGEKIPVEIPTHIAGVFDFENGAVGTIITSFDVWGSQLPRIEIYGTSGTLIVPDPNNFGGEIFVKRKTDHDWSVVPLTHGFKENSRGIGAADMAKAIRTGGANRASGELAYHVLDVMHAFIDASESGKHVDITSGCKRPEALPMSDESEFTR